MQEGNEAIPGMLRLFEYRIHDQCRSDRKCTYFQYKYAMQLVILKHLNQNNCFSFLLFNGD